MSCSWQFQRGGSAAADAGHHINVLGPEFVGFAIRLLNRPFYGNWRERIGILSRYLRDNAER